MKIRCSYVSNSSSSSFVALGREVNSPVALLNKGETVMLYVEGAGTSGDAEDWAMILNQGTWSILSDGCRWFIANRERAKFYHLFAYSGEDGELVLKEDTTGNVITFRRDYSSPDTKDQLLEFLGNYA